MITGVVLSSIRSADNEKVNNEYSKEHTILIQPKFKDKIAYKKFLLKLKQKKAEILLCCSYSLIIREDVRKMFNNHCYNIHGALLPQNRGVNPIQWAIIKGEREAGVTLHKIEEGIDSGPIVAQRHFRINKTDTWVTLFEKLTQETHLLLRENLPKLILGDIKPKRQDEANATVNHRLNEDSPFIDFKTMTNHQIYNLIRAQVHPLKGAYIIDQNQKTHFNHIMSIQEIQNLRRKYED